MTRQRPSIFYTKPCPAPPRIAHFPRFTLPNPARKAYEERQLPYPTQPS
jgi:hypothetical protein